MRVADQDTLEPIGYRRALIRVLVYVLGGMLLYIGLIWGLFDRRRQTWHDKAARSVVVLAGRQLATWEAPR